MCVVTLWVLAHMSLHRATALITALPDVKGFITPWYQNVAEVHKEYTLL